MKKNGEGAILQIDLTNNRRLFARVFASDIGIYDFVVGQQEELPSVDEILRHRIFLYCNIFEKIIDKKFPIVGYAPLTPEEIRKIPPKFHQDLHNINDCTIYWDDGTERKAFPEECVGLERSAVWEAEGLKERLEDHLAGNRNFDVEYQKVILSNEDPRYKAGGAGPHLKWNFEKKVFYLIE